MDNMTKMIEDNPKLGMIIVAGIIITGAIAIIISVLEIRGWLPW